MSKFLNTKNYSAPVGRGHNNELNRTGLEPVSALNFLLGDYSINSFILSITELISSSVAFSIKSQCLCL